MSKGEIDKAQEVLNIILLENRNATLDINDIDSDDQLLKNEKNKKKSVKYFLKKLIPEIFRKTAILVAIVMH